jgi:hypothetical protein
MRHNPTVKNIHDFGFENFEFVGYDPQPSIKTPNRGVDSALGSTGCQPVAFGCQPNAVCANAVANAVQEQPGLRQAAANYRLAACAPQKSRCDFHAQDGLNAV